MNYHIEKNGERIPKETKSTISDRYKTITKAINREFWDSTSETAHSFYVGSHGRKTAINTSDIDILVELPKDEYNHYDILKGNGQSRLLQAVKDAIQTTYSRTDIRADGQVVKVSFSDGMKFEVLPAFQITDIWGRTTYQYPDSNMGGNWCSTDPKAEQQAIMARNESSNGLLNDTCKHIRYVRDNYFSSYHLSGIVIDSFVYTAIGNWHWKEDATSSAVSDGEYELYLYNHFINYFKCANTIQAPGSNDTVNMTSSLECLEKVLYKITQ